MPTNRDRIRESHLRDVGRRKIESLEIRYAEAGESFEKMQAANDAGAARGWASEMARCERDLTALRPLVEAAEAVLETEPLRTAAYARCQDPITSFEAAATMSKGKLRRNQLAVLWALYEYAPAHDYMWMRFYLRHREEREWPKQARSGLQTRRKELVDAKYVRFTGKYVTLDGGHRRAKVWDLHRKIRQRLNEITGRSLHATP